MTLDHHMFGLTDWRLPSPSSTPKSANFPEPTLQTPRNDSFSTHFTDAWSTPRANAHQTPTQTPLCRRNSTCERPLSSYSQRNLNPDDPSFHVNHFSPHPNLPLPPVDPSCRLSSSPGPGPTSAGLKSNVSLYAPLPTSTALADSIMNISQMQTPPPTRDASSQRRGQRTAAMDFNTPSTIFSRRDSAPGAFTYNTADDSFMETPGQMFPTLQLTPDLGNFTNTGPMTAPIEARILWDQNGSSSAMDYQMTPARRQSFGPSSQSAPNMLSLPNVCTSMGTDRVDLALMPSGDDNWTQTPAMATTATSPGFLNMGHSSGVTADSFVPSTTGVDPNILFGLADNTSMEMSSWMQGNPAQTFFGLDGRHAYDKQVRDNNGGGPVARSTQQPSRPDTASSSHLLSSNSRPGLARSNTHSGAVRRPNMPGDNHSNTLCPNQAPSISRKTSPLKRTAQSSLASISEHTKPRPRTRLVIDESGSARTETIPEREDWARQMDHRTRYPGLWDGEDSDTDSNTSTYVASQQNSFSIPAPEVKRSKSTKGESSPTRASSVRTEKSPFSFTQEGISKKLGDRLGRLTRRRSTTNRNGRNGAHSVGGLFGELLGGPVEAPVEDGKGADNDKGDAQDALKELMERSKQRRQGSFKATNAQKLEAHNQRWAQASADLSNLSTSQTTLLDPFVDAFNPSPSNISPADMLTPSTDRSGLSSGEGTHCICSSTGDDGQLMVQCESCSNWYHLSCLGLPQRPELLPQVYICAFCTGETPTVRGGRVRDPFRSSIQAHQQQQQLSPLGYKTYQR